MYKFIIIGKQYQRMNKKGQNLNIQQSKTKLIQRYLPNTRKRIIFSYNNSSSLSSIQENRIDHEQIEQKWKRKKQKTISRLSTTPATPTEQIKYPKDKKYENKGSVGSYFVPLLKNKESKKDNQLQRQKIKLRIIANRNIFSNKTIQLHMEEKDISNYVSNKIQELKQYYLQKKETSSKIRKPFKNKNVNFLLNYQRPASQTVSTEK